MADENSSPPPLVNPPEPPNGVPDMEPLGGISVPPVDVDPNIRVIPRSVTPRQVRLMLLQQELLNEVEAMVAAQDEATQISWQYASEFYRNDPLLLSLAQSLGLTSEQIDDFFIAAARL